MDYIEDIVQSLKGPKPVFQRHHGDAQQRAIANRYRLREKIAAALNAKIDVPLYGHDGETVVNVDGVIISIDASRTRGRLVINSHKHVGPNIHSANWWYEAVERLTKERGATPTTEITVAESKSADDIAKDIKRKLLPDACAIVTKAEELLAAHGVAMAAMDAFEARFIAAVPGSRVSTHGTASPYERTLSVPGVRECRLTCYSGKETIRFAVDCAPVDSAIAFLKTMSPDE